jgi:hypothetical protein
MKTLIFIGLGLILLCVQMVKMQKTWMVLGIIGLILQPLQIYFNLVSWCEILFIKNKPETYK